MPGLVPGIHVFARSKAWMAGTSPAMTKATFRDHAFYLEHDLFRKPVPTFRDHALAPPEQFFDVEELELDISGPAVITLAGIIGRLHLAQERVHLLGLE